jgi:hypothetical protein
MSAPSCWHRAAASYRRDALDAIALLAARAAELDELRDELTVVRAAHDELARRYDELRDEAEPEDEDEDDESEPEDDEPEDEDEDDEPEDDDCPRCQGTGIGHGPPDVSRCGLCGGSGMRRRERDWGDRADEAYERARDCRLGLD